MHQSYYTKYPQTYVQWRTMYDLRVEHACSARSTLPSKLASIGRIAELSLKPQNVSANCPIAEHNLPPLSLTALCQTVYGALTVRLGWTSEAGRDAAGMYVPVAPTVGRLLTGYWC